ncbi:MAG: response regulator [Verrucomicrobiota bacterium]|jgi:PAS domain S-box-containing protein
MRNQPKPAAAILIVDDDPGLLRLAARTLERQRFAVSTAASGAQAVQWLQAHQPDLLLLDLKLQDAQAGEVISQLAALGRLPSFLIITGQGDERMAVEMMKSGALDYVVKGKDFLDFLPSAVARALQQVDKEKKLAAAEAALRLSEERLRVALKHSPVMVFNQDAALRYTWVHNAPIGLPEKNFIGKTDEQIFPAEEADRLRQIKARALATGTGLRQEVSCTLGGSRHFFDLTVELVRNPAGEITGITCAAMDISGRKRLEQEVLHISEMEQRRIGQDLHDGVCQRLAGIEMKCHVLAENLQGKAKSQAAQARQIAGHVRDVIAQTRSLARGLSPVVLESEGLASALRALAEDTERLFDVRCRLLSDPPVLIHNHTVATHLYRIAQEAVTNAIKHGRAKSIEINLSATPDNTVLMIKDNGAGLAQPPGAGTGMGLRIMQYRAGMIGARVLLQQQQNGGAIVLCFLPNTANTPASTPK